MTKTDQPRLFEVVRFTPGEQAIARRPEKLTPSQWAEKYLKVPYGPWPGPFRVHRTPYLAGILDTYPLPWVREIAVCAGDQLGKTLSAYICQVYSQTRTPRSTGLITMPDEETGRRVIKRILRPLLTESPRLAAQVVKIQAQSIDYHNASYTELAWSGSQSTVASIGREFQVGDEPDKYVADKAETGIVEQIRARARPYPDSHKIVWVCTPTTEHGAIWQILLQCSVVMAYQVPCPECGTMQAMTGEQIKYPEDASPAQIEDDNLGWYECPHCQARWTDADRDLAVSRGEWVPGEFDDALNWRPVKPPERPSRVGFWLPAFNSRLVGLSRAARAKAEAEAGLDIDKAKAWANKFCALPWTDVISDRKEETILALRDDRPAGIVPKGVAALLAGVDVHKVHGLYYVIRAFGYGLERESWLVRHGYVDTWSALFRVLFEDEYRDPDGHAYPVAAAFVDSGDQTDLVYSQCLRWRGRLHPCKGAARRLSRPISSSAQEYFPNGKRIPGGLTLHNLDTHFFKDALAHKLQIAASDPGAFHLHSETTEDYARQMCAEVKDAETDRWENPRRRPNHYWDCEVYVMALAEWLGVKHWPDPQTPPTPKPKPKPKPQRREPRW